MTITETSSMMKSKFTSIKDAGRTIVASLALVASLASCSNQGLKTWDSTTRTCGDGGKCKLGDIGPGGGTVFLVDNGDQIPLADYFEFAPNDLIHPDGSLIEFENCISSNLQFEPQGTLSGKGPYNSKILSEECPLGPASAALSTEIGGLSDWYLPTIEELKLIYSRFVLSDLGKFIPDNSFSLRCSSSFGFPDFGKSDNPTPLGLVMNPQVLGVAGGALTASTCAVRPVRSFEQ